jgi:hypothetical protein
MMNRTQLTLGGILVLQIALIVLTRSPWAGASAPVQSRALLPALAAITPSRLEVLGQDDARVTLLREGGRWTVEQAGGFPADAEKIDTVLETLKGISVRRPVVSSSRYHEAFKVGEQDHEGRIRVFAEGADEPAADLILGSSPNYRTLHVRKADEDAVYEVRDLASYDVRAAASAWIDKVLVSVDRERVVGLRVANASGSFELAKRDGSWSVVAPAGRADRALDPQKIDGLLQVASSIRLADAAGPLDEAAQGLREPAGTFTILWRAPDQPETEPPREVSVRIGGPVTGEASQRYVTRSDLGFAGTVWDSTVARLLEEKLDQLLAS